LVFFVISHVSFCLQIRWTEDSLLTRNRFPSKANCRQIRRRNPYDVLMFFNKFQIWRFFLNPSAGPGKRCGEPHAARGPVVEPHCSRSRVDGSSVTFRNKTYDVDLAQNRVHLNQIVFMI